MRQGSYIQRELACAFVASAPVLVFGAFFQHRIKRSVTMMDMTS